MKPTLEQIALELIKVVELKDKTPEAVITAYYELIDKLRTHKQPVSNRPNGSRNLY